MRSAAIAVAGVVLLVLLWYAAGRVTSSARVVRAFETGEPTAAAPRAPRLKVLAWNIAHGRGAGPDSWAGGSADERTRRLDRIAALLAEADADVVVLNEIDFRCTWSHGVNQAETLAAQAGYPYRVEQRNLDVAIPFLSYRFGNAVLSRYPITASELVAYPARSRLEAIGAGHKQGVVCTIAHPRGPIRIAAVHLDHADRATRVGSARRLLEQVTVEPEATFLAGDFNSGWNGLSAARAPGSAPTALSVLLEGDLLHTDPATTPGAADHTYPSYAPRMVIDWILAPPSWTFVRRDVIATDLSDHLPVFAELRRE